MLQLIFFGRLDTEKGREAIIAMIDHFSDRNKQTLPFVLHVFGSGQYAQKVLALAEQFPEHIIYYGFQPLDHVKKIAEQCDYCLMPSLFLETFGLSAVNALSRGLPVIGYQKGGLTPFVVDAYNLGSNPGSPSGQLATIMEKLIEKGPHNDSHVCKKIAEHYSKERRIKQFQKLTNKDTKKILLVTDFVSKLGGIETYVHDVAALLQEHGYSVEIIGGTGGKTRMGKIFSMFFSVYNIVFAWKLQKKIQQLQPDLIRCHSVLRNTGRLPLRTINTSTANKRMMYHDLGYFHPFPHSVAQEEQIPTSLSWKDFSSSVHHPFKKFFIWGKWILLTLLQKQLKHFDLHLIPSDFMQTSVKNMYEPKHIEVLSHFTQE